MRACCAYVSRTLRQARIDADLQQEELYSEGGLKDDCGALAHAENGTSVLPFKYLFRHLDGLGLKAVVVRPGLIDWNPSPAPIPWSRCSSRSENRCIGGSGKKLLNKSLLALLIHLFILFLQ